MRGALGRACTMSKVEDFLKDLDWRRVPRGWGRRRPAQGAVRSNSMPPLLYVEGYPARSIVMPTCANFLKVLGCRTRKLALANVQKRAILAWGAVYRPFLKRMRGAASAAGCICERDSALHRRADNRSRPPAPGPQQYRSPPPHFPACVPRVGAGDQHFSVLGFGFPWWDPSIVANYSPAN